MHPAARMQPSGTGGFNSERLKRVVALLDFATADATSRRRAHEVAVQPLNDAAFKGSCLGLRPWQPTIELGSE